MPLVLQRFSPGVISSAQLNSMEQDIENKFAAALTAADMAWPFTAGGNISMAYFQILNLPKLWNTYNLADRNVAGGVTVQSIFDEVDAAGGGAIFLPPDTTETLGSAGVTVGSNTLVYGGGWSSVFAQTSAPSNTLFRNKAVNNENIWFINLRMDGTGAASGTNAGIKFNQVKGGGCFRVEFGGFRSHQVDVGADTPGNTSERIKFDRCHFEAPNSGTTGQQMFIDDVDGVTVFDCDFDFPRTGAIGVPPSNVATICRDVQLLNNRIKTDATNSEAAIFFTNSAGGVAERHQIIGNRLNGGSAGSHARILINGHNDWECNDNSVTACTNTQPAFHIATCNDFVMTGNITEDYSGDGICIGTDGTTNGTPASRLAQPCTDGVVANNHIRCGRVGIILRHGGSSTCGMVISDNQVDASIGNAGTYSDIELWNCNTPASGRNWDETVITGNRTANDVSNRGLRTFEDNGATPDARVGLAANANIIVVANSIQGTVFNDVLGDFAATENVNGYRQGLNRV